MDTEDTRAKGVGELNSATRSNLCSESPDDVDQQHGAGGGDDQLADDAGRTEPEEAEDQPAEHRADDAEQEIHEEAVAASAHDLAREEPGEDADEDLPDKIHAVILRRSRR